MIDENSLFERNIINEFVFLKNRNFETKTVLEYLTDMANIPVGISQIKLKVIFEFKSF